MRKYKRMQYIFSFKINGYKDYWTVLMLPQYTKEQALAKFAKSNPIANDIVIESRTLVTVEM